MTRDPEYQLFLDYMSGRLPDPYPQDKMVKATKKDKGWIKQRQVARGHNHKGRGIATLEELRLIKRKDPRLVITREELLHASRVWR